MRRGEGVASSTYLVGLVVGQTARFIRVMGVEKVNPVKEQRGKGSETTRSNSNIPPTIDVVFASPDPDRDAKIMRRVYARILGRRPPSES